MKTETKGREIEITEIYPIRTTGAVPPEAQFKVVFEYREAKRKTLMSSKEE